MSSKTKPLALTDTLRDLALLRASGVDLSSLVTGRDALPDESRENLEPEVLRSTQRSYEFVAESRAALRIYNSGELLKKSAEVQKVQGELDEILDGLSMVGIHLPYGFTSCAC
ncbi:hypothetical protein F5I97DRAFT_700963 [Phlebopus sp. FC_14]|nr:hypothetical protein F5I97DRAFT_700963 [Phlebopus sp. FC_14]